ncbi:MAG: HAMP domain-containing histidine kinase [Acidimicrobiia bacterium]|nr:HAMP domain-containing histidine kinase [Acidimicrobiia bacterium]
MSEGPPQAPPIRFGLRRRIIIRFAAIGLIISTLFGVFTYVTVRQQLLRDRTEISIEQAAADSRLVFSALQGGTSNPTQVLAALRPRVRSTPLLLREGEWFAASLQVRPEDLPDDLVALVVDGQPARQRVRIQDVRPVLVVGIPEARRSGGYFEVYSLRDVEESLQTVGRVLVLAGLVSTAAGVLLGGWMAGRVVQPLREVTAVARRIADGALETRLDESIDDDLALLTNSFNRMADTVQERIAREERFASDVAHELRTPLTSVMTSLAVLEGRRDELSVGGREALGIIGADVERLRQTVADLTEIAKLDAGVVTVELEPAPVTAVVASILNRLRRDQIIVDADRASVGAMVVVDERRLERALFNLIENADTHGGGVDRIVIRSDDRAACIAVEDDGPGLEPSEVDRIFERFARGSTGAGRAVGSGLGLAIAAENVELQGGRMWGENIEGGGARFVIELPVEAP